MKIMKIELAEVPEQIIETPLIYQILDVQLQYNKIVLWASVIENEDIEATTIVMREDDDVYDEFSTYIGSVQTQLVKKIYHIFYRV